MNISASIVNTLALSLLHFLWQGALIAALAGSLMVTLRKPATRYLAGVGAVVLMIAAFGTTIMLIGTSSAADFDSARAPTAVLAPPKAADVPSVSMLQTSRAVTSPAAFTGLALAWIAGVSVFALRIAYGLLVIDRLRRRSLAPLSPERLARFEALQRRLGIRRVVRYFQCEGVSVPAVIGVFRPIVLLPMRVFTGLSAEQIDAVIAHELGHVQRFDVAVNFLQVIAETLLFFHPAVWWLNRRIRAEREDCCDDFAVAACNSRVGYAKALATMEGWRQTPSFAMAATNGPVAARVARLLGLVDGERNARGTRGIAAVLVLTTAMAVGALSLGVAHPAFAQQQDETPPDVPAPPVPAELPALPDVVAPPPVPTASEAPEPPVPARPKPPKEPKAAKEPKIAKEPKGPKEPKVKADVRVNAEPRVETRVETRVEAQMRTEIENEMRFQPEVNVDVSAVPETYLNDMRSLGINGEDGEFVALYAFDVKPKFVRAIKESGLNPSVGEIVAMKSTGVTADYVKSLVITGLEVDASGVIRLHSVGISAKDMAHATEVGFHDMTVEKLVELKLANIL